MWTRGTRLFRQRSAARASFGGRTGTRQARALPPRRTPAARLTHFPHSRFVGGTYSNESHAASILETGSITPSNSYRSNIATLCRIESAGPGARLKTCNENVEADDEHDESAYDCHERDASCR